MSAGKGGFFASKQWKNIMKYVYGLGAAVVIVGALFKIMHWPGSGVLLTVGLLTEAGIFVLSVLEPIHEDPHWELVYPELALGEASTEAKKVSGGAGITQELDKMLEEAKIDSALLERLGDGMRTLGDNAAQLKGVTSAAAATDGYVTSLQAASEKVSSLSEAYERASVSIAGLTSNTAEGESFGEQMQKVSKNLASLNNVYELQLKGSTSHLEATEKFHSQVVDMMANLSASAEDTRLYKENMAMLSKNLTDLNNVYGNMLKAMRA
ncbi:MAG: gliding motility protein GldL [Bacteroidota bacterium]